MCEETLQPKLLSCEAQSRRSFLYSASIRNALFDPRMLADISPPFGGSTSLSFSVDGNWVATADGDSHVRVFNAATAVLADFRKPGSSIIGSAFVGDHYVFAAASDNQLGVWSCARFRWRSRQHPGPSGVDRGKCPKEIVSANACRSRGHECPQL